MTIDSLSTDPWQIKPTEFPSNSSLRERLRYLIGYAVLAPSSHNTEPWRFRLLENQIEVRIDFSRWLRVADDDQRELHISVGCALENLLISAEHFGLDYECALFPKSNDPSIAAVIAFGEHGTRSSLRPNVLFDMITVRHTNHQAYEDRPIPEDILEQIRAACIEDGIVLYLTNDSEIKKQVDDLVVQGDALEFADPEFRKELAYWIGQGVFGTNWLMSKIASLAVSYIDIGKSQAKKDSDVLMSSPILGLICSRHDDRQSQLRVGQVYQRLSLLAASFGLWCQPMSQIVQIPDLKEQVARLVPELGLTPQHPFRIGFAPAEKHHTPRRPVELVLD